MNLDFSPKEKVFRDQARAFVEAHYPDALRGKTLAQCDFQILKTWHQRLYKKGWIAPGWPKQYGGAGWSVRQQLFWAEELARAQAIAPAPFGIDMLGPLLLRFGTDSQKKRFLPKILSAKHWWCQGFSETEAGSDLAAVSTRAVRKENVYVVNGHKIWTTMAHRANWIFCLVRTNVRTDPKTEKKQAGISFLLIDMNSPGVFVRPIVGIDGLHEVNQVFFEDVEVPFKNRLGGENDGWRLAKFLLAQERFGLSEISAIPYALARLRQKIPSATSPFCARLAELELQALALKITQWRFVTTHNDAAHNDVAISSFLKVRGTELQQKVCALAVDMESHNLVLGSAGAYLNARKLSVYGGTNEIQRNIIARIIENRNF